MNNTNNRTSGHRYPTEIISHAIWLYYCFTVSFRDVDEILATRGIDMIHECVRRWCLKFGYRYVKSIRSRTVRPSDTWHLDEVFISIRGERH